MPVHACLRAPAYVRVCICVCSARVRECMCVCLCMHACARLRTCVGLIDSGTQQVNQGSDSVRELATEVRNLVQSSTQPAPKVALKETVSQVSEVSATQLTTDELIECYKQWQIVFGKNQRRPPVAQDPSADQLSSINYLLGLKDGSASKIDFAVFGPLQQRLVKRQKLQGVVPNSRGEMVPIELYGPATWAMFKACWAVYQNALVLLKAVDLGNLISYGVSWKISSSDMGRWHIPSCSRLSTGPGTNRCRACTRKRLQSTSKQRQTTGVPFRRITRLIQNVLWTTCSN